MCTWATLCPLLSTISPCSYAPLCFLKKKNLNFPQRKFPHQPHKTSCPQPFVPMAAPWAYLSSRKNKGDGGKIHHSPSWTEPVPGWPHHLCWVHTRHQPLLGGGFPSAEFPNCKSKSVGLQSSLLPKHQRLLMAGKPPWGHESVFLSGCQNSTWKMP